MTPDQFVAKLCDRFPAEFRREVLLTARLIFQFQHDNLFDAQFADARPVRQSDILGQREWFEQLAEAANRSILFPVQRDHICPDCGHEHEDKRECKKYLGEGRFCPCESKVPA